MTEPDVASSDATNIRSTFVRDGDSYVVNGRKIVDLRRRRPAMPLAIFMGLQPSRTLAPTSSSR